MTISMLLHYKRISPFTADGLVDAVNEILCSNGVQSFTKRTLRFYISEGIIPSAKGPAKFARYGYEHLLGVLAARLLQTQGYRLDQIQNEVEELKQGSYERIEAMIYQLIEKDRESTLAVHESVEAYDVNKKKRTQGIGIRLHRIQLTPNCYLEIAEDSDIELEIKKSVARMHEISSELSKSA